MPKSSDGQTQVLLVGERDLGNAADAAGVSPKELLAAIRSIQEWPGRPLKRGGQAELARERDRALQWAHDLLQEVTQLRLVLQDLETETAVAPLLARRSVSPKRLKSPGPTLEELDLILQAALRAPDHGNLLPWRVLEFRADQRADLADHFEQEKLRRDPLASKADLGRARAHATLAPVLLGFVVSPKARTKVPVREQWLAAGAALCNLLNAAHQLGFGAIMLSGERCFDSVLTQQLGLTSDEFLAGFISVGRVAQEPPKRRHAMPAEVWSCWIPRGPQAADRQEQPAPDSQHGSSGAVD
ncbi:MAG TPA: nitroreductase [Rhizobacter sp.]|nr:nitroreductase [Rhizobacter sp.]